jgi:beta-lactamase superfamily II metal-dependent hydrolase
MRDYKFGKYIRPENTTEGMTITDAGISASAPIGTGQFRIQFHAVGMSEGSTSEDSTENEISPIITVEYKTKVFVITGDAGIPTETAFMQKPTALAIFGNPASHPRRAESLTTFLRAGHHGSKFSTGVPFANFLLPKYAVFSVGFNTYGHPTQDVKDRLSNANPNVEMYSTRDDGNVVFRIHNGAERFFLAFENPVDLSVFYFTSCILTICLAFFNFKKHEKLWCQNT